jgi:hypothetical protein
MDSTIVISDTSADDSSVLIVEELCKFGGPKNPNLDGTIIISSDSEDESEGINKCLIKSSQFFFNFSCLSKWLMSKSNLKQSSFQAIVNLRNHQVIILSGANVPHFSTTIFFISTDPKNETKASESEEDEMTINETNLVSCGLSLFKRNLL